MQKKFLYLSIACSLSLGAALALVCVTSLNPFELARLFYILILAGFSSLLVFLFRRFKADYFSPGSFNSEAVADPFTDFDINSITLGELARKSINALSANSIEIQVSHFNDDGQLFAYYYARDCMPVLSAYKETVHFKLNSEFDAALIVRFDDVSVSNTSLIHQFAVKFSYILSELVFSAAQSRFVDLAKQSLKAKTGFLANLSHEVRAPLGVILNATELVLDGLCGEINDNQKKFLSLSKKSSDHLLDLINDVLDFAKIEAGKITPQPKQVSVSDTLRDVLNMMRLLAESKNIEVSSREADLTAMVDKKHFRQILINLATNAVKYTREGGEVEVWAEMVGSDYLRINVKDNGVGISEEQKHKVFKPFERLEEEYSKQQGGVGIGLSLAKKLAEMNAGTLDFESVEGQGTTFFLIVPAASQDLLADSADSSSEKVKAHGETIIIVDTDLEQAEIVATYLRDLEYHVACFVSLDDARQNIQGCNLIIIDNHIFDEQVKSISEFSGRAEIDTELPVILLSSRAFVFDLERYLKLGVERCLPKPAPLKELAALCREILERHETGNI